MAWVNKYHAENTSFSGNDVSVYIQEDGFAGTSTHLDIAGDGVKISCKFKGWNEPVLQQNCTIRILNNLTDYFTLDELLTNEEKEFRVLVTDTTGANVLFKGFLNVNTVSEPYLTNKFINLTASNYVSKLTNTHATIVDTIGKESIIDVLNETLKLTGLEHDIYVNCSLFPSDVSALNTTANTAFNFCGIDTENFWKNNQEKKSGFETINMLLKPFDSYLYKYNDDWYIERYEDIWQCPRKYVKYAHGSTYSYLFPGTDEESSTDVSTNFHDLTIMNQSQTRTFQPGLNKIKVKLNRNSYANLATEFPATTTDVLNSLTPAAPNVVVPDLNTWEFGIKNDSGIEWSKVDNYYEIADGVKSMRRQDNYTAFTIQGSYTKLKITIDPDLGTSMNLKYKFIPLIPAVLSRDYRARWFLKLKPYQDDFTNEYYIMWDETNSRWYAGYDTLNDAIEASNGIKHVEVNSGQLNSTTYLGEVDETIDLADASIGLTGDYEFILGILWEQKRTAGSEDAWEHLKMSVMGDVKIAISAEKQDNVNEVSLTNNFMDEKTISLDFYDSDTLNDRSVILTDPSYNVRTQSWVDDSSATAYHKLAHKILRNKSQLYRKTRKKISATINSTDILKPLSMWWDEYDPSTQYLLTSFTHSPISDKYACEWDEYDNRTNVYISDETAEQAPIDASSVIPNFTEYFSPDGNQNSGGYMAGLSGSSTGILYDVIAATGEYDVSLYYKSENVITGTPTVNCVSKIDYYIDGHEINLNTTEGTSSDNDEGWINIVLQEASTLSFIAESNWPNEDFTFIGYNKLKIGIGGTGDYAPISPYWNNFYQAYTKSGDVGAGAWGMWLQYQDPAIKP